MCLVCDVCHRFVRIGIIGSVAVAQGFCLLGNRKLADASMRASGSSPRFDRAAGETSCVPAVTGDDAENPLFKDVRNRGLESAGFCRYPANAVCFLHMALGKSVREKEWGGRKRGMQAMRAPCSGEACELAGVTRAQQAKPLSARLRT
jgi:hypothetical protein